VAQEKTFIPSLLITLIKIRRLIVYPHRVYFTLIRTMTTIKRHIWNMCVCVCLSACLSLCLCDCVFVAMDRASIQHYSRWYQFASLYS